MAIEKNTCSLKVSLNEDMVSYNVVEKETGEIKLETEDNNACPGSQPGKSIYRQVINN